MMYPAMSVSGFGSHASVTALSAGLPTTSTSSIDRARERANQNRADAAVRKEISILALSGRARELEWGMTRRDQFVHGEKRATFKGCKATARDSEDCGCLTCSVSSEQLTDAASVESLLQNFFVFSITTFALRRTAQ
jgi:hypothetical protein